MQTERMMDACLFEVRLRVVKKTLEHECLGEEHFDLFFAPVLGGQALQQNHNVLEKRIKYQSDVLLGT